MYTCVIHECIRAALEYIRVLVVSVYVLLALSIYVGQSVVSDVARGGVPWPPTRSGLFGHYLRKY